MTSTIGKTPDFDAELEALLTEEHDPQALSGTPINEAFAVEEDGETEAFDESGEAEAFAGEKYEAGANILSAESFLSKLAEDAENEAKEALSDVGGVELTYEPLFPQEIPPDTMRHIAPQADDARRMLTARMLTPLPPKELVLALYCLMNDANSAIKAAAEKSFDDLPPNLLRQVAAQRLPVKVLDYIARDFFSDDDPERVLEALLLNPALGDDTLLMLTRVLSGKLLDLIINNQTRLIKTPQVVRTLPRNPRITVSQLSRALEFARREKIVTADEENELIDRFLGKTSPAGADVPPSEEAKQIVENTVQTIQTADGETDYIFPSFLTTDFEAEMGFDADAAHIESKIKGKMNMRDIVRALSVPQKMRMAVRGNMEARKILIEDALSLVAREVLKNPRLTKTEVERAAASKMIDGEVIEGICKNAGMTRSYPVRMALVTNPKTPLRWSSRMLFTLFERDIRSIAKSKAVSSAIQNIARQKIDAEEQRRKARQKKKKK